MRDCVTSRLRLPDLNWIRVDCISDADADLASFLSDCTPARLKLFNVNYYSNFTTGIKSKFYVDAFSQAAARTIKEVFFNIIDFSAEDLQTVVRAARNAEIIVFYLCCIHCSSGLDFGASSVNFTPPSLGEGGFNFWKKNLKKFENQPPLSPLILRKFYHNFFF